MVNSKLKQSFRIVIEFTSGKAYFRLCLDTTLWLSLKEIESHMDLRSINVTRYHKDQKIREREISILPSLLPLEETHMLEYC